MNTGIPPITNGPAGATPSRVDAPAAKPAGADSAPPRAANPVSLPVSSNSSKSISDGGEANSARQQDRKDKPSLQEVIALSEKLNESVQKIQRDLNFSVDDSVGEIVVKVVDRSTEEVIWQIPSEEMLNLSRNIEEVNSLLFDKIKA